MELRVEAFDTRREFLPISPQRFCTQLRGCVWCACDEIDGRDGQDSRVDSGARLLAATNVRTTSCRSLERQSSREVERLTANRMPRSAASAACMLHSTHMRAEAAFNHSIITADCDASRNGGLCSRKQGKVGPTVFCTDDSPQTELPAAALIQFYRDSDCHLALRV